jgi:hypothetical protein
LKEEAKISCDDLKILSGGGPPHPFHTVNSRQLDALNKSFPFIFVFCCFLISHSRYSPENKRDHDDEFKYFKNDDDDDDDEEKKYKYTYSK